MQAHVKRKRERAAWLYLPFWRRRRVVLVEVEVENVQWYI